jgi:hypothetical protein
METVFPELIDIKADEYIEVKISGSIGGYGINAFFRRLLKIMDTEISRLFLIDLQGDPAAFAWLLTRTQPRIHVFGLIHEAAGRSGNSINCAYPLSRSVLWHHIEEDSDNRIYIPYPDQTPKKNE